MPSVELFVRNEKGEERVARVDVAAAHAPSPAAAAAIALLPAKLVLSGYTREPALVGGQPDAARPTLRPTALTLSCGDDGGPKLRELRHYLAGRKKAALAPLAALPDPRGWPDRGWPKGWEGAVAVALPRPSPIEGQPTKQTLRAVVYAPAATPDAAAPAAAAPPAAAPSWGPSAAAAAPKRARPSWAPNPDAGGGGASPRAPASPAAKKRRMATMAEKIALGSQQVSRPPTPAAAPPPPHDTARCGPQHRDIGPDESLRLPAAISWDTDGMVLQDPLSNRCVYYQDKGKRYRFVTDATEGMPLLCDLVTTNRDLLARNEAIMGVDAAVRDCPRP